MHRDENMYIICENDIWQISLTVAKNVDKNEDETVPAIRADIIIYNLHTQEAVVTRTC